MNYKESAKILKEIKKAKKILVNCHRGPDPDSVSSALALAKILEAMGREVLIICPSEIPDNLKFLPGSKKIKRIDFSSFKFSEYDLFIAVDSSDYSMVSGSKTMKQPKEIPFIVIDHHFSNSGFGKVNLIDPGVTSTGELLFKVFEDWNVKLDSEIAQDLLTGIIGDTGVFQYQNVGAGTLEVAANLIRLGAQKDEIVQQIYRNVSFAEIKIWGKIIENMEIDKEHRFVWSTMPITIRSNFVGTDSIKEDAANLFFPVVQDTYFGVIMEERGDSALSASFRSRSGFDVSKIAQDLGGGGHRVAAGAQVEGLSFEEAVEKVLFTCRKYAKRA